ncbi:MAG: universal stress protein [Fimbriiglobus sp.]|jgi:nucleotide-binding universal stress UspA family protein|nr:universal stress protein [Fimbriiglobus sp.]
MGVLNSILLATDFRPSSDAAAAATVRLAHAFGSSVTVLHVREEFLTWPVTPFENQDRLTERLAAEKVQLTEFLVRAGPPADTVVRLAQERGAHLLVIGAGEKVRDGHLAVGPVAESILERAEGPVLALNPHGPDLRFASILCPVDHSRVSRRGLEDAIQLARAFGGRLTVLSVVPEVDWLSAAVETGQFDDSQSEHETRWRAEFDQFLAGVSFDGVEWRSEVRVGVPHEQIVAAAREQRADLIAMGATGRTGILRVLLGSVTRRVLRQLPCSLLLVKDEAVFEEQFLLDYDVLTRLTAEGDEHQAAGRAAEAVGRFRQALALAPYHTPALEGIVHGYDVLGQPEAGRRYRIRLERLRNAAG